MTKTQLIALGLTDDLAQKCADASAEELKGYVPAAKYDEAQQAAKTHADTVTERDKQLAELKKAAGSNEELTAQITKLQADNKAALEAHQQQIKDLRVDTALKLALTGGPGAAHDPALVAGLLDRTKIELAEDGGIKSGYKEQVEGLRKSKAFLFAPENPDTPLPPGFTGAAPADGREGIPGESSKAVFPFNFQTVRPMPDGK